MSKSISTKYVSLQGATKYCDYSQEYLSLRARQGKLKALKFGRNWVTTKAWIKGYESQTGIKDQAGKKKTKNPIVRYKRKSKKKIKKIRAGPPSNLPIEKPVVSIPLKESIPVIRYQPKPERKFSVPLVKHTPLTLKEMWISKIKKEPRTLLRFEFVLALFFVLLIGVEVLVLQQSKVEKLVKENKFISKETALIVADMSSKEVKESTIDVFKEYTKWLKDSFNDISQEFIDDFFDPNKRFKKR